jgi:hypothetical protein
LNFPQRASASRPGRVRLFLSGNSNFPSVAAIKAA